MGCYPSLYNPLGARMQLIAIALAAIIGTIVVAGAAWSALASNRHYGARRWVSVIGYGLMAFGGLGFFGLAVSSFGGFRWLPSNFEWPVGAVHGALTMSDGTHVVPVKLAGNKIQIYNPDWRFLRGWYVPAGGGGQFELQLAGSDRIEVITRRPAMLYLYEPNGLLISTRGYAPKAFADFPGSAENARVPTPWWLWMVTSPIHSWLIFGLGFAVLFLANRLPKMGAKMPNPALHLMADPRCVRAIRESARGRHR